VAVIGTPRLIVVADLGYAGTEVRLLDALEALAPVATDPRVAVQLRAKTLDEGHLEALAQMVRTRLPRSVLILNGPADLAARLDYEGVHWPEATLPDHLPPEPRWQSSAVHDVDALRRAERAGVDAAVFGSVFVPGSKAGTAAGTEALRAVCEAARIPVIAIGGVTPQRVARCLEAGAAGVAVVSGVLGARDPARAVVDYLAAFEQGAHEEVGS
jgi:thiamine-phosphate diphosphorylase